MQPRRAGCARNAYGRAHEQVAAMGLPVVKRIV